MKKTVMTYTDLDEFSFLEKSRRSEERKYMTWLVYFQKARQNKI